MEAMKIDTHIHTCYSYDSDMHPKDIIATAKERGLGGVIICDHDTIKGGVETDNYNDDPSFTVIIGAEIKTNAGDIMGFPLTEEIVSRDADMVCDEIHRQGGKTVLVHPYEAHDLELIDFSKIDFIEVINARVNKEKNERALALAKKYNKPILAGSDAHRYNEIGNAYIFVESKDLLNAQPTLVKSSTIMDQTISQLIKARKYKSPKIAFQALISHFKRSVL